tara:strand:- start:24050 stop:25231 length:1182 start_codon:yes stop_codon:yes gene_type:complete
MNQLSYLGLISKSLSNHTKKIINIDQPELLTYYIENQIGNLDINLYYQSNKIFKIDKSRKALSLGHSLEDKNHISYLFREIDKIIDLDFEEVNSNNGSDIDIYSVKNVSSWGEDIVGEAIPQIVKEGAWWDIIWLDNTGKQKVNKNELNTIVHEIGHALGLSHPFEDPFNPLWDTSDSVMSYNISENGWNTWFSDTDLLALISIWGRENDNGEINFENPYEKYTIKRSNNNKIFIQSEIGYEEINDIEKINFADKSIQYKEDIIDVFNLLEGVDDITGKIFRLYTSLFDRFPDKSGYDYWIKMNKSNQNTYDQTITSFIRSIEFEEKYGVNSSNDMFIQNLYKNILSRESDRDGYTYWLNQLESGEESRTDVLRNFSESLENISLFTEMTGID